MIKSIVRHSLSHTSRQEENGPTSSTMSQLGLAMAIIVEVFARYGGTDSNKQSLNKGELKVLLEKELLGFLQSRRDKDAMDKLLKDLDTNGDATMNSYGLQ